MENIFAARVEAIRALMRERGWDVVILTGSDPHASEYPARRWKQVEWVSGFTGEAGDMVVTLDHAGLWTDTRYFIQAVRQLSGTGIELHKMRVPEQVPIPQWLAQQAFPEPVIAVDGLCQSASAISDLKAAFEGPVTVVSVPDLLSPLWKDRPAIPSTPIITLGEDLAGESREARLHWLRKWMILQEVDADLVLKRNEELIPFNPSKLIAPEDSEGYRICHEILSERFLKEPSKLKLAEELLYKETLLDLPHLIDAEEGRYLASKITEYLGKAFEQC
jgi:hypothetical protein